MSLIGIYDAHGNQLTQSYGSGSYITYNNYDSQNRLVKSAYKSSSNNKEYSSSKFMYNGEGIRIRKEYVEGKYEEVDNYYYLNGMVAYTTDQDDSRKSCNIIGNNANVISSKRYDDGKFYFYNKDIKGSTTTILNDAGTFVTGYKYTDFGVTEPFGNTAFYNEICYAGGIYDEGTDLYYLNARYYDPVNSRMLTQDTYRGEKTNPRSLHLYAYCANNPINYTDPTGHWGANIHREMTDITFRKFAYKKKLNLSTLKESNVNTDVLSKYNPRKYHGLSPYYNWVSNSFVANAAKEYNKKNPNYKEASRILGVALHTAQDYYAHNIPVQMSKSTVMMYYQTYYILSGTRTHTSTFDNPEKYFSGGKWKSTSKWSNSRIWNSISKSDDVMKSFLKKIK